MIKNWNYKNLQLDYSSMYDKKHPSDIDMFYIKTDGTLIFGEIKNESYKKEFWENQKKLFEQLIDGYSKEALFIFIIHNKYVQNGDTKVDVPDCYVKEYYYKGKWHEPRKPTKVKEVLEDEKI